MAGSRGSRCEREARHKSTLGLLSSSAKERSQRHAWVEDFGLAHSMLWVLPRRDPQVCGLRAWRSKGRLALFGLAVLLVELRRPVGRGVVPTAGANYYHALPVSIRCDLQRMASGILYKAGQVGRHAWALPAPRGDRKPRGSQARRAEPASCPPVPVVARGPLWVHTLLANWRACRWDIVGLRAAAARPVSYWDSEST